MSTPIQLLDTVAVVNDLPEFALTAGEVGVVVELLSETAFDVEFSDETGVAYGLYTLRGDQIVPLHLRGATLRLDPEAA